MVLFLLENVKITNPMVMGKRFMVTMGLTLNTVEDGRRGIGVVLACCIKLMREYFLETLVKTRCLEQFYCYPTRSIPVSGLKCLMVRN
jgi:hypothetical protein